MSVYMIKPTMIAEIEMYPEYVEANSKEEALALAEDLFESGSFTPYPEEIINAKYEINKLDEEEAEQEKPFILAKIQDIKEKP